MRVAVFSGTSDGRELCKFLAENNIEGTAFVATEYGKEIMEEYRGIDIHTGRLTEEEMEGYIREYKIIIDATHPYAEIVTKNIRNACKNAEREYLRLIRENIDVENAIRVKDTKSAVEYLMKSDKKEKIFVSTGSKELGEFKKIESYRERVYARVIPSEEIKEKCKELGFDEEKIIFKQGPFSYEENREAFKKCQYLVTKESGKAGGFEEKIRAAKDQNMKIIIIERPNEEKGYSKEEIKKIILKKLNIGIKFPMFIDISEKKITVIGGGKIATRRIKTLLKFGAKITVIAKEIEDEIKGRVKYIEKKFEESDIDEDNIFIIGATDKREVNHQVYEICKRKGIRVNIIDCPSECDFFFPAICKSEDICIGIASRGNMHRKVKEIAEKIRNSKLLE